MGMTVTCGTKPLVHAWSTIAKHLAPNYNPIIIAGGPAAAFEAQSILQDCPHVDVVVKGEGEVAFPPIVTILRQPMTRHQKLAELSELEGVCVRGLARSSDKLIPRLAKAAFDSLPFPDLSASPVSR
jgi:radical SAM superfamily enzyme YgiQ (UPF0313 family)